MSQQTIWNNKKWTYSASIDTLYGLFGPSIMCWWASAVDPCALARTRKLSGDSVRGVLNSFFVHFIFPPLLRQCVSHKQLIPVRYSFRLGTLRSGTRACMSARSPQRHRSGTQCSPPCRQKGLNYTLIIVTNQFGKFGVPMAFRPSPPSSSQVGIIP